VLGSYAVGQSLRDGTLGVVTVVVFIATADDNVCAAKELVSSSAADLAVGAGSLSSFTSTAATLLSGAFDALVSVADWPLALGVFVGFVSSSSSDSELVLAPPVLTTTPVGASGVVDPVEVDVAVSEPVGCCVVVESVVVVDDAGVDDVDSEDDESGVSAHATPHP
jgi:hypothetical protein